MRSATGSGTRTGSDAAGWGRPGSGIDAGNGATTGTGTRNRPETGSGTWTGDTGGGTETETTGWSSGTGAGTATGTAGWSSGAGMGTTERSTATPDTPVITGLDTVAGPETTAPGRAGVGATADAVATGTAPGRVGIGATADAVATGTAPGRVGIGTTADAVATGTAPGRIGVGATADAVATGTAPAPARGVSPDGQAPANAGEVSAERLPTRLSVNKAKHAAAAQSGIFRLGDLVHSDTRPTPEGGHMLGIVAWGTALALAGVGVGIRGLLAIIGGLAPVWYQPALIGTGLLGVLLTVGAFVTIQRRYAPWMMLAFATIPLAVAIALTIIAL
ncbi:hypothetical protein AB0J74_28730 [Asanoa sp. NPDC049573]|uniref:hypothetical protein n=1 Tax=Asanoa sp. NPDC049573 TaxID=3155396 RepID=UPI00343CE768